MANEIRLDRIGQVVIWDEAQTTKVTQVAAIVFWATGPPPLEGQRTFPLPQAETIWQSQSGKRTFPLPGVQE